MKNGMNSVNMSQLHRMDPKVEQDRKQDFCTKIREIHERLISVMVDDL